MKFFLHTIIFLLFIAIFYSCDSASTKPSEPSDFIPKNSLVVFKINDLESLKSDIKNNSFLSKLENTKPYSFFSENKLFKNLHPSNNSLLCISEIDSILDYTFITKVTDGLFNIDSVANKLTENITVGKLRFQKNNIENQTIFTTIKDSIFIASSSQEIIENILNNQSEKDPVFQKIFNIKNTQDFTAIFPADNISVNNKLPINFASWAALDIEVLPDAITASGIVLIKNDSVPQLLSVFKGLSPQRNNIAKVTPTEALRVTSFMFNDFEIFKKNLQKLKNPKDINYKENFLFETANQISEITLPKGKAIVLKSTDPTLTNNALAELITPKDSYKDIPVFSFNNPSLFVNYFDSFIDGTMPNYTFKLGDFFIFSENKEVTQHIITSYLNNNCLINTAYYKEAILQLSDESSLVIMELNNNYSNTVTNLLKTNIKGITFNKYPLVILQFSYDRDFAHINLVCKEASLKKKSTSKKVSQLKNIKLDNKLLGDIQFFSNHRTGGKDIIAVDISNKLYFISSNGKTLWTKKLKNPILGKIQEVDILKNGKKQLAFTTKNNIYVLDRNGRNIAPFPIKFNDDITQPLAIFDYENNRKYRFVITQNNEVLMLDSKGKTVKGFTFKKATSNIISAPQHFRINNKDYIVIAEKNGKLNILSRVGKSRISISKKFNFSEIPITSEKNNLVIITKDNTKHSISQKGKIASKKLSVSNYWFVVKGKTKVTLDDNLLRINGTLIELPFGIYTAPKIIIAKQKIYISLTETQENKVYIYNKSGELLPGFPIYGTSTIDLGDVNKNGRINFIVKGQEKEILLFEL